MNWLLESIIGLVIVALPLWLVVAIFKAGRETGQEHFSATLIVRYNELIADKSITDEEKLHILGRTIANRGKAPLKDTP